MNLLPRAAEKSMKRQRAAGRFFLLGIAVVLFVVLGPGVGKSISKQQDPRPWQTATSVKLVNVPISKNDLGYLRSRRIKERAEHRQFAKLLQAGKISIDPAKRKKVALLLLLAGGQARNIRF